MTSKKKSKKKKKQSRFLFKSLRLIFLAGLWIGIFTSMLVAWYALELPSIIDRPEIERDSSMTILAADQSTLARYGELKGVNVHINELPNHMIYAVMAVEDRRFYQHFGIDPVGLVRAMGRNLLERRVVQGGSTITQQLAKNLFLSPERTLKRKIQEALLALWLEHKLTKDEILTAYLNRVYLGAGAYGIDAAARTYFSKSSKHLSLYESALLAGLLKAPSRYSPQNNPSLAARRAKVVLSAMADAGYIEEEDVKTQSLRGQAALAKPSVGQGERYFTDYLISNIDEIIGKTNQNLMISSTLDPDIQSAAEKILAQTLRNNEDKEVTQGAIIVMAPDGAILAMVGGADFRKTQFNRATQAIRPPGSSFKPFVYLTALEAGWDMDDEIIDEPIIEGKYKPGNFREEYFGEVTLEEALTFSLNTVSVRLMKDVGVGNVIQTARRLGINSNLEHDLSLSLGSSGIPLIEMVTAYAVIANRGLEVEPYAITKIEDDNDNLIYFRADDNLADRVIGNRETEELTRMLASVVENGTGRGAMVPYSPAGKTGTSQDFRDAWFIGFTDKYVAGVWLGNDDNSPTNKVTGGSLPAIIWRDVMMSAHKKSPNIKFPVASSNEDYQRNSFKKVIERVMYKFNE